MKKKDKIYLGIGILVVLSLVFLNTQFAIFAEAESSICEWTYERNVKLVGTGFAFNDPSTYVFSACTRQPLVVESRPPYNGGEVWEGASKQLDMGEDDFTPDKCSWSGRVIICGQGGNQVFWQTEEYSNEPCSFSAISNNFYEKSFRVDLGKWFYSENCISATFLMKQYVQPRIENLVITLEKTSAPPSCTPNWVAGEWSDCKAGGLSILSGIQERTLSDGCGNTKTETQTCTIEEQPTQDNTYGFIVIAILIAISGFGLWWLWKKK